MKDLTMTPTDPIRPEATAAPSARIGSLRECLAQYVYEARAGYGVDQQDPAYRVAVEAVEYHISRAADRARHDPAFAQAHVDAGLEALERLGELITAYGDPIHGDGI